MGANVAAFVAVGGSMHNFYMFHGGTMWGNWSTTVRRTRLTPSYANSANLASDSIIYNPKYDTIAGLHVVLLKYAASVLHTPLPIAQQKLLQATTTTTNSFQTDVVAAGTTTIGNPPKQWFAELNGTAEDPDIVALFNDDVNATTVMWQGQSYKMAGTSCLILGGTSRSTKLWYSEPTTIDGVGQPYVPALTAPLTWTSWNNSIDDKGAGSSSGTWYRTTFEKPTMPAGAQMSVNLTGFGTGNMFLNGVHVVYFDLTYGECFRAPGGVNFHGSCLSYVESRCDKPTQDCYHVPPEWIAAGTNEMLVWSESKLPLNITVIEPSHTSVVYRVDGPSEFYPPSA
jgi:hypothetical protein